MAELESVENHDVIVIGGGQAGLAAAYHLMRAGADFVVLDASERTGDVWRQRWDSLRLFTPAHHDGLPGMPFPAPPGSFPAKDEVAGYLSQYVDRFSLPVRNGVRVTRLTRVGSHFEVLTSQGSIIAGAVVVATGANQLPHVPALAQSLDPHIGQLHSHAYRSPDSVPPGEVLVVGFGTSGAEIAEELALAGRTVSISGEPTFHIPDPVLKVAGELYWHFIHRVLTRRTPIGRKAAPKIVASGAPLIRISASRVEAAGVKRVPRVVSVTEGRPVLADGSLVNADVVVWCTGYAPDFSWIDVPGVSFDERGWPRAPYGLVENVEGLAFVGVPFQVGLTSVLLGGVGRDAAIVVDRLVQQRTSNRGPVAERRGFRPRHGSQDSSEDRNVLR
ncbi:MAG: NAD(P)/FAD-dependent oxidoreductase [Truepera sp.]|jgi:putative flavoprotein involved in K+ transport|nr:NAD(P)/FAD-dependent oxidoreductase [Truepera sp.]